MRTFYSVGGAGAIPLTAAIKTMAMPASCCNGKTILHTPLNAYMNSGDQQIRLGNAKRIELK